MVFRYFEHQADIGIIGEGSTLAKAFEEAAKAMFGVMADLKAIKPAKKVSIKCSAEDEETLLIEWLNELLAQKDIKDMMFSEFKVKIKEGKLVGLAYGEKLNTKKHKVKVEVKAATYSQLKVKKEKDKYIAQCVVDV